MPSPDPQRNQTAKHRACDECRSRKLACTKEPNGCSRCVREGIRCHYSEQKPMGRPRKRQRNGEGSENTGDINSGLPEFPEIDNLPYFDSMFPIDPYHGASDPLFISDFKDHAPSFFDEAPGTGFRRLGDGQALFRFGNDLNVPIDFGADDSNSDRPFTPDASSDSNPKDALGETYHNLFAGNKPYPSAPGPPCSCLATMYLAMSSLQEFPTVVETALGTVRAAANAAQAAIRCDTCSNPAVRDLHPPIEMFQNTMLLITILPIIVNGYKRLLVMVDEEVEIARAAGTKKIFAMKTYGGLGCVRDSMCGAAKHLDMAVLEPTEWRGAVRGLLRADVYGLDGVMPGLKGIILEMEERQRKRHGLVDHLSSIDPSHENKHRQCRGEKDLLCMRLIDTAKFAIDSLVIA